MEYKFAFEKLDVWQKSRMLTTRIYKVTKDFPNEEKFGIISLLRRASVSICSNLAEGNSRSSAKDRANFFQIAYSSTMEVLNQLIIACDLNYIHKNELSTFREKIVEISNKINALYKVQKR